MDKVVHFEIPAQDTDRADKFYSEAFGWDITKAPLGQGYDLANTVDSDEQGLPKEPGAINGGIGQRDEVFNAPVLVIDVESIDQALAKVEAAGGQALMLKQQVGDIGLYARFKDPEGNVMGLWENLKAA
jgi:uncharacterized protein